MSLIPEFLRILFLSKITLLTPSPINVNHEMDLYLDKPISAITEGAHIELDVSSWYQGKDEDLAYLTRDILTKISSGSIKISLENTHHDAVTTLVFTDGLSWGGGNNIRLLVNAEYIPIGTEFNHLHIESKVELDSILVYWKNSVK
ncbi:hypothetical protein [Gynuella sunshinyii]|uniref:hypothetical protein n=1 Tax=Gynuella sunshinyii TaxID=1445505 RepID=UPI0005CC3840|nr:hypothetical protein [Gynuella sunshinyii]